MRFALILALCAAALQQREAMAHSVSFMLFFDLQGTEISALGQKTIEQFAGDCRWNDKTKAFVLSHTDAAEASDELARARGKVVLSRLVKLGFPADRIVVRSFDSNQPLVPTPPGTAEPQNRRVELVCQG